MEAIFSLLDGYIDPIYMISFILISYAFKNAITDLIGKITNYKLEGKFTVLIIGFVLGIVFYNLNLKVEVPENDAEIIKKLIASYALGTSTYELLIKGIIKSVKNKMGIKEEN